MSVPVLTRLLSFPAASTEGVVAACLTPTPPRCDCECEAVDVLASTLDRGPNNPPFETGGVEAFGVAPKGLPAELSVRGGANRLDVGMLGFARCPNILCGAVVELLFEGMAVVDDGLGEPKLKNPCPCEAMVLGNKRADSSDKMIDE